MLISPISFEKVSLKKTTFPEPKPTPIPEQEPRKLVIHAYCKDGERYVFEKANGERETIFAPYYKPMVNTPKPTEKSSPIDPPKTIPMPEPVPTPVPIEDTREIIGFYDGPDDCGPIYGKMK